MPISTYNPDGTVNIYNKKTGEVRQGIRPEELGTISPSLVAEYEGGRASRESEAQTNEANVRAIMSGALTPGDIPAENRANAVTAAMDQGYSPTELEKDPLALQKKVAVQAIGKLEERYGRGDAANIGTEKDLSLAGKGERGERAKANRKQRRIESASRSGTTDEDKGFLGFNKSAVNQMIQNPKDLQDYNIYKNDLETIRGIFTQAFGSGTPQEGEAQALMNAAPGIGSSNEEAKAWFADIRSFLGENPGVEAAVDATAGIESPGAPPALDGAPVDTTIEDFSQPEAPSLDLAQKEAPQPTPSALDTHYDADLWDEETRNPVVNFFLSNTVDYTRDVVSGIVMKGKTGQELQKSLDTSLEVANAALIAADTEQDPEKKKFYMETANDIFKKVGDSSKEIQGLFSDSIGDSTLKRSVGTATELASVADLPFIAKGVAKKVGGKLAAKAAPETITTVLPKTPPDLLGKTVNIVEKAKRLTPKALLGGKQAKAVGEAADVVVDSNKFLKAGEKFVKMEPDAAKTFAKQKEVLKNVKTIPDLMDQLGVWNKAYLKSGGVKASAKGQLYNTFYATGLQTLKEVAPDVYKYRRLLSYTHNLPSLKKVFWYAFPGVIGGSIASASQ